MTSENNLIKQAQRFDEQALAEIYDRYSPGVFRYAMRLLGDSQLAEDCVADTFFRYLKALRSGRGPVEHLQAYLYRIAHNWITDTYRRQPPSPLQLDDDIPETGNDPMHIAAISSENQTIRHALMRLSTDQRQVIVLKYLEGWENKAVAEFLQKSIGSVKALQHRALLALRRSLLSEEEGDALNENI